MDTVDTGLANLFTDCPSRSSASGSGDPAGAKHCGFWRATDGLKRDLGRRCAATPRFSSARYSLQPADQREDRLSHGESSIRYDLEYICIVCHN